MVALDSFHTKKTLTIKGKTFTYYSLQALASQAFPEIHQLPYSLKILLENLLRHEDGRRISAMDIKSVATWSSKRQQGGEISYKPARVLMQDFTGVPAVVDLASMRDAMMRLTGNAQIINPLSDVDLVIDHSIMVDKFGNNRAFEENKHIEYARNHERYKFLKWGQKAFDHFGVVPPGTGICHQVNIERLAKVVWTKEHDGILYAYPDTLVGTDSHTTMVNGLGVLGWGVGGIEAEAVMLGQPISMLVPEVIGFKLEGEMTEGLTATDLVLTITQMLREKGVVGKFVEFYGPGLTHLALADRATISNMAPEYGATCGFFPVDRETLNYLHMTGRPAEQIALVETYCKAQGLWRDEQGEDPLYTDHLHLDLRQVVPCLAGPKRPQDKVALSQMHWNFQGFVKEERKDHKHSGGEIPTDNGFALKDGDVVIAAITSCTNTSNPAVMIGAGLLARNARRYGLKVKPWVKTSLAPGSQVVTDYLEAAGLQEDLNAMGFNLVGYGCTTCIGNSGPLNPIIESAIEEADLIVASVLSGNRNFEGRVNPLTKANYLASPPLVIAFAIAGSVNIDLTKEPLGIAKDGQPVYLHDIWPSNKEINAQIHTILRPEMFIKRYEKIFFGDKEWAQLSTEKSNIYAWDDKSTYIKNPPYFKGFTLETPPLVDIKDARPLAIFGDSITTDHISPAGTIPQGSPAGLYLLEHKVAPKDFNSYGSRRGNHEIMMRGTFANIRIRNEMVPGTLGGFTRFMPEGTTIPIFDAAMAYQKVGTPLIVIGGKEYGAGSSRDWAAKGTKLLGVKAVITESFERIHRSNLIGMGVLPLTFPTGITRKTLNLDGTETFTLTGIRDLTPKSTVKLSINRENGDSEQVELLCRIDTADELLYFKAGGILAYVLRTLAQAS